MAFTRRYPDLTARYSIAGLKEALLSIILIIFLLSAACKSPAPPPSQENNDKPRTQTLPSAFQPTGENELYDSMVAKLHGTFPGHLPEGITEYLYSHDLAISQTGLFPSGLYRTHNFICGRLDADDKPDWALLTDYYNPAGTQIHVFWGGDTTRISVIAEEDEPEKTFRDDRATRFISLAQQEEIGWHFNMFLKEYPGTITFRRLSHDGIQDFRFRSGSCVYYFDDGTGEWLLCDPYLRLCNFNPRDWEENKDTLYVRRLPPAAFPDLPEPVRQELERRHITVPQSYSEQEGELQNVIKGRFTDPEHTDWAVYCMDGDSSYILVFPDGKAQEPIKLEQEAFPGYYVSYPEEYRNPKDSIDYGFYLDCVSPAQIAEYNRSWEEDSLILPDPLDHDGMYIIDIDKCPSVLYLFNRAPVDLNGEYCD
ncbi:hypothetical protein LLH00_14645 [bacterium]|nr:hypothetical protein [bacterium]